MSLAFIRRGNPGNEAAALGKAGEGEINLVSGDDEEALLEALSSRGFGPIAQKSAQLKELAGFEHAINVRIPIGAMPNSDVQAILLKRAKKPSGSAKAVAQLLLDVSRLPITQPKAHQVQTGKMWAAHQCVIVQLVEKAQAKVRARSTPSSAPSRCVTLTPPTHPPTPHRAPPRALARRSKWTRPRTRRTATSCSNWRIRTAASSATCQRRHVCVCGCGCVCVFVAVYLSVPVLSRARAHTHTQ